MTKKLVFADYCDNWFRSNNSRLKPSSCAKYYVSIEKHIKPYFGGEQLYSITSERVEEFTRMLICEKNLSVKTVRDILVLFHSIFIYAGRRSGYTSSNVEIIYPKKRKNQVRVLNGQEEKGLLLYLAKKMDLTKFGIYIALRTGLRIGELCALRWNDISLDMLTISVTHTVQRVKSFDNGDYRKTKLIIGPPKSDSARRMIPLMPDLAALCRKFDCGNSNAFLLTGTDKCMEPRKMQRYLKSCLMECDIPEVHFHTLRHTFATRCIEVGFDVKTLSEILGHANISITMNQYVHPDLEQKRENMSRLNNVINF